ncbi:MAG: PspC domain-containing protein [Salinibacter sp.]
MANRERTRSPSSSASSSSQHEAFDAGKTTLDLDDISEEELESLYFEDDEEERGSLLNLQTVSGLTLILAGIVYLLSEIGVWTAPLFGLGAAVPWLVGVLVILVGFGILTWHPSGPDDTASRTRKKAVDASTGETKVVEEPTAKDKKRLTRSRTDKKLMGVCGGIAEYLNLDPTLVRIAFVIGVISSFGPLVLAYFGLAFAMPKEEPPSPEERLSIIRDDD